MGGYTHMSVLDVEDSAEKFGFGDTHESRFVHGALEAKATGFSLHRFKPGKRQPSSRDRSARRSAGEIVRVLRPIESGLPSASRMRTRLASQPSRRAVSGCRAGPSSKWQAPFGSS